MTGALRDVKNLLRISLLDLSGCGVGEFFLHRSLIQLEIS